MNSTSIDVSKTVNEVIDVNTNKTDKSIEIVEVTDVNNTDKNTEANTDTNTDKSKEVNRSSYANVVKQDVRKLQNKLMYVPTEIGEDGSEVVIFDAQLVTKGSVQWNLTICGYFVGHKMNINELRYHIRRMWGKFGIGDIRSNAKGTCLFKFRNEEWMNKVLEQGPWMVNNKPLIVQKWDPEIGLIKVEPDRIPVWVKLVNILLEAWSVEGISALASSLGKPVSIDIMKTNMCQYGEGRLDFTRVLEEIQAVKGCKEKIEVQYRDKDKNKKGTKEVKVEYDWKPDYCKESKVFGHSFQDCTVGTRTVEELEEIRKENVEKEKKEQMEKEKSKSGEAQVKRNYGQKAFGYGNLNRGGFMGQKKRNTERRMRELGIRMKIIIGINHKMGKLDRLAGTNGR